MNKNFIIDESGDTGYTKKSSRYFIIAGVNTDDIGLLRLIAKKIHRNKKEKKKRNGLHANQESIQTKNKIIELLKNENILCIVSSVDKHMLFVKDPYLYTLEKFAQYISNIGFTFCIIIAKRDTRKRYNESIIDIFLKYNVVATLSDPLSEKALQIADFYSWIIFSHFENNNSSYFNTLKHQIIPI